MIALFSMGLSMDQFDLVQSIDGFGQHVVITALLRHAHRTLAGLRGKRFDLFMASFSLVVKPPQNPERFITAIVNSP